MTNTVERSEERHGNEIEFLEKVNKALQPIEAELKKDPSPLELKYEGGKSLLRVSQVSPTLIGKIKTYLVDAGLVIDKQVDADAMEAEFELPAPADDPQH